MMDRYTPCASYIGTGDYLGDTELHPEGDYVLYEDAMAEIERLRAALRPFANACDGRSPYVSESLEFITWADLRRAKAALRGEGGE